MGAWGPGIFSDDLAADVRGDWRELILDGAEPATATRDLQARYEHSIGDSDEAPTFWISLAAAQQETGRLQPEVRDMALGVMDVDLERWRLDAPESAAARERSLRMLAEKLRAPQPAPKELRRTSPRNVEIAIGTAIRLWTAARTRASLWVVVGATPDRNLGYLPHVEPLLWEVGDSVAPEDLASSATLMTRRGDKWRRDIVVAQAHRRDATFEDFGEIVATGVARPDVEGPPTSYAVWARLVEEMEGSFWQERLDASRSHAKRKPFWRRS